MEDGLIPIITCAVCDKPIVNVTTVFDFALDRMVTTVICHGQTDRTIFPLTLFRDGWQITHAKAFEPKLSTSKEVVVVKSVPVHDEEATLPRMMTEDQDRAIDCKEYDVGFKAKNICCAL